MPVNVVRTPEEEIAWARAKARAREQYPGRHRRPLLPDRDGHLQEDRTLPAAFVPRDR